MALFKKGTQDVVYVLEEGWGAQVLKGFIWFTAVSAVFAFYAWTQFRGLKEPEAMDYAQVAHNMAGGAGFVTQCIRPADLAYMQTRHTSPAKFPDIRHAPLYPAVLATGFAVLRPSFTVQPR